MYKTYKKMEKKLTQIKEEGRDLWLQKMGNRPERKPEEEKFSWMEYFEIMDDFSK